MINRNAGRMRSIACAIPLALAASGALAVERPDEMISMEQVDEHLLSMQNLIHNARVKIDYGMAGASREESDQGRPPTPAEDCCNRNIEKVSADTRQVTIALEQWDLYYSDGKNMDALKRLNEVRAQLGEVSAGMAEFKRAATQDRAKQAIYGIIRPFTRLRTGIEGLKECCAVPAATAEAAENQDSEEK